MVVLVGLALLLVRIFKMLYQHNPLIDITRENPIQVVSNQGTNTSFSSPTTRAITTDETILYCVTIIADIANFALIDLSDQYGNLPSLLISGTTNSNKIISGVFARNYRGVGLPVGSNITLTCIRSDGGGLEQCSIVGCSVGSAGLFYNSRSVSAEGLLPNTGYLLSTFGRTTGTPVRSDYKKSSVDLMFAASNANMLINGISPFPPTGFRSYVNQGTTGWANTIFAWTTPLTPISDINYIGSWNDFSAGTKITFIRMSV